MPEGWNDSPKFHLKNAIGDIVVVIVMSNRHHGSLLLMLQPGKNLTVELAAEWPILFGCPFIKQENRFVFQKRYHQGEALALSTGKT